MGSESGTEFPVLSLNSGHTMPVLGLGTFEFNFRPEKAKLAFLEAIKIGYRHFDSASLYGSEGALGEAISEAVQTGLIGSRKELFITSKLWCHDNHPDLVLPAIRSSLRNLKMEYLDLYLVHWPIHAKPGSLLFPMRKEDLIPFDLKGVWKAMEQCQRLGLVKSIGVSNFTTKRLNEMLTFAEIPPSVNQVEMHPAWRQEKLKEYCAIKGINLTAYSPLGGKGSMGGNPVLASGVLKEIADAKGKTVAQISLRWLYVQGVSIVVKSFSKDRLAENTEIFDWELTPDERQKINTIPQEKVWPVEDILYKEGSFISVDPQDIEINEA
ncbi:NAD(P)-linked oxidoreductase superfamily protein [Rhynchospora pubera]|uniref:NAD(P)-linked oxidoreductase superfamily protein n=1 Tax=Rhynchospora pubera TaxID=906938 RepID=A0AAV8EEF8_9POAL|nr:NAD(P)-linked oxidoreductase superfamily protein [Rhynchospora pubera]